jgi:hypothetical protein
MVEGRNLNRYQSLDQNRGPEVIVDIPGHVAREDENIPDQGLAVMDANIVLGPVLEAVIENVLPEVTDMVDMPTAVADHQCQDDVGIWAIVNALKPVVVSESSD